MIGLGKYLSGSSAYFTIPFTSPALELNGPLKFDPEMEKGAYVRFLAK